MCIPSVTRVLHVLGVLMAKVERRKKATNKYENSQILKLKNIRILETKLRGLHTATPTSSIQYHEDAMQEAQF